MFPSGTSILVRVEDIHFDSTIYDNPHAFNPDNFSSEALKNRSKYAFCTFSHGSRGCIGELTKQLLHIIRELIFR